MPTTEGQSPNGTSALSAGEALGVSSESRGLYRLLAWLSPSYPIGAFSYSHGLETAIEEGFVHDLESLNAWLEDIVEHGTGRNDALFLRAAYEASTDQADTTLTHVAELATAFQPSSELALEAQAQGQAFFQTTAATWPTATLEKLRQVQPVRPAPLAPLAVVVGVAAAGHGIPLEPTLHGYLHAFGANLASASVRLIPLGQTDGQRAIAALEPIIARIVSEVLALKNPLDHLASNTVINDWCSMRHETQYTRLFRS